MQLSPVLAQDKLDLFPYLTYLEDKSTTLTLEQVQDIPANKFIKPAGKGFVAPNSLTAVYWLKVDLRGIQNIVFTSDPILYLPYREFTSLTYYKPLANGDYQRFQIGRRHGLGEKDVSSPHIAFSSDQRGWQQQVIYFRADFRDYGAAKTLPAFLYSQSAFAEKAQFMSAFVAASYAIFVTMLIYNLSFFLAIREKFFAYYIVYLLASWVVCMGNDGIWGIWLIPAQSSIGTRLLDATTIIGCICAYLAFLCEILNVKKNMPWIIWPVRTVYLYGAVAAIAILFDVDLIRFHFFNKDIVGAYSLCYSLVIFSVCFYKKIPYVRVVAPASLSLITLGAVYSAYLGGNLDYNEYLPWTMTAGFAAELCVLSMMIAVKIRQIIRERETAKVDSVLASRNAAQQEKIAHDKSRFLAHVGHDMRQPLYVLRLQLALLKTKIMEPTLLNTVTAMKSSVDSIEAMFDDILYMSQLESGAIVPKIESIDMAQLLHTIRAEFSAEAEKRGIRLSTFCTHGVQLDTDSHILKRILRNLVQNALRHTESGGVLIACRRRGKRYRIDVIDSGFGIDKLSQEKLFKPSQNMPGSQTLTGNFGLGLSIVATLSRLIAASIEVRSEPEKGSRFSIYLPLSG